MPHDYWNIWVGDHLFVSGHGDEHLDYAVNWLRKRNQSFYLEWL